MDKTPLREYPEGTAISPQNSEESSSTSGSNLTETASDKRYKKRKKSKSHHGSSSSSVWKNLSNIFTKSGSPASVESTTANLVKGKDKGSALRRLSSFFRHRKPSRDDVTVGVSPSGYQAAVSETKFEPGEETEIAMAIRLPSGVNTENFAVTVELEALNEGEEPDIGSEAVVMKCCAETKSKTVFSGVLKVPPELNLSKLSNMPLYIVDSHEQLVYHPDLEMTCRKLIRPSEEMLLSNNDDYALSLGTIKVNLRLNKLEKPVDNHLMNIRKMSKKSKDSDAVHDLDEVRVLGTDSQNENEGTSRTGEYALDNFAKEAARAEVRTMNESAGHVRESLKRAADLKHIPIKSRSISIEGSSIEFRNIKNPRRYTRVKRRRSIDLKHVRDSPDTEDSEESRSGKNSGSHAQETPRWSIDLKHVPDDSDTEPSKESRSVKELGSHAKERAKRASDLKHVPVDSDTRRSDSSRGTSEEEAIAEAYTRKDKGILSKEKTKRASDLKHVPVDSDTRKSDSSRGTSEEEAIAEAYTRKDTESLSKERANRASDLKHVPVDSDTRRSDSSRETSEEEAISEAYTRKDTGSHAKERTKRASELKHVPDDSAITRRSDSSRDTSEEQTIAEARNNKDLGIHELERTRKTADLTHAAADSTSGRSEGAPIEDNNDSGSHAQETTKSASELQDVSVDSITTRSDPACRISPGGALVESQNSNDLGSPAQERIKATSDLEHVPADSITTGSDSANRISEEGAPVESKSVDDSGSHVRETTKGASELEDVAVDSITTRSDSASIISPGGALVESQNPNDLGSQAQERMKATSDLKHVPADSITTRSDSANRISEERAPVESKSVDDPGSRAKDRTKKTSGLKHLLGDSATRRSDSASGRSDSATKDDPVTRKSEEGVLVEGRNVSGSPDQEGTRRLSEFKHVSAKSPTEMSHERPLVQAGTTGELGSYVYKIRKGTTDLKYNLEAPATGTKDEVANIVGLRNTFSRSDEFPAVKVVVNSPAKAASKDKNDKLLPADSLLITAGRYRNVTKERDTGNPSETLDFLKSTSGDVNDGLSKNGSLPWSSGSYKNRTEEREDVAGYKEDQGNKNFTEQLKDRNSLKENYQPIQKITKESSTQYSNIFTTDKAIDIQGSLALTNYGIFNEKYRFSHTSPATSSSRTSLFPSRTLTKKSPQASSSFESSETIMPKSTTTTTTAYSSTLPSEVSSYYDNDLKVPLNSPISTTDVQDDFNQIRYVRNALDLSVTNQQMDEMSDVSESDTSTTQNSQSDQHPSDTFSALPSSSVVERMSLDAPSRSLVKYCGTEEELYLTDFDEASQEELKSSHSLSSKQERERDKTLELLEDVRIKLEAYLIKFAQLKRKSPNWFSSEDDDMDRLAKKFTDVRNVSVTCNNPFNLYGEINTRCYEDDDDEYYEAKRNDVRRFFQSGNLDWEDDVKKNFDFYLSGDSLNTKAGLGDATYQAYPLIVDQKLQVRSLKSQARMKLQEVRARASQSFDATLPAKIKYNLPSRSNVGSKLEAELNTLQQLYESMRYHMKFLLDFDDNVSSSSSSNDPTKSRAVANISEGLTDNFDELKSCLSTINQILAKSTSSLQNVSTALPSAWELFPIASDVLCPPKQTKKADASISSIAFGDHPSIENLTKQFQVSSTNPPTPTVSEFFPPIFGLQGTYQPSGSFTKFEIIIPTILEPLSDLLVDYLPSVQTLKPFGTTSDHSPKETQSSRSKNIYTVQPPTLEPISTISDLLRQSNHNNPENRAMEQTSQSEVFQSNVIPTSQDLFPTFLEICDYFNRPSLVEQAPPANSKSPKNVQSAISSLDVVLPEASELFPFWECSSKSSQDNLASSILSLAPTASEPLPTSFPELDSSEISQTYFAMESEIERTIQELLKESEDIKEAVILNGGEENAEPPFSVEYMSSLKRSDPLAVCKIMEDVINSSMEEDNDAGPTEEVKQMLNALVEQIVKSDHFLDNPQPAEANKSSLAAVNFLYHTPCHDYGGTDRKMQIGDASSEPTSSTSKFNERFSCFCSAVAFIPKIPKTSFSFGETPSTCTEVPPAGCKTPMRRRDGLTLPNQDNLETSRLFNELLNLQSDMSEIPKRDSSEEEFSSAHDIMEEDTTVSGKCFNLDTDVQDKPIHTLLQVFPCETLVGSCLIESESNEEDSDDDNRTPPKRSDRKPRQNGSNQTITKSRKTVRVASSSRSDVFTDLPSTSRRPPRSRGTTEEEELMQDVDLTKNRRDSSTRPIYMITTSGGRPTRSQPQSNYRQYSATTSEEVVSYVHNLRSDRLRSRKAARSAQVRRKGSYIPLRSTDAVLDLSQRLSQCPKLYSPPNYSRHHTPIDRSRMVSRAASVPLPVSQQNSAAASDSDYDGDIETIELNVLPPKLRFKSKQELNTPEEIAKIEENVKANDKLLKVSRLVLAATDSSSELEYEDSSGSDSEYSEESYGDGAPHQLRARSKSV